ncbi:MAG: GNAT family N-acetyltransferase [Planctomycetota bacterium]|jgi:phosphinothricin acetyltransferase|nr:GNAT family N-acetyltransferase [Planctomycetota bacterium]
MTDQTYAIKPLYDEHTEEVMEIFNHYIETGFSAYFDQPVPCMFFARPREMSRGYPTVVAVSPESAGVGFALLHAYHSAPIFNRTAETTYFIHPEHTHKGLGKLMLERLIGECADIGVDNLVARIFLAEQGQPGIPHQKRVCGVGSAGRGRKKVRQGS